MTGVPSAGGAWFASFALIPWIVQLVGCGGESAGNVWQFPDSEYVAVGTAVPTGPLVGVNYTHDSFEGCSWFGHGIVAARRAGRTASVVHAQLGRMRAAGIVSLRLILWHMRDVAGQHWGVVPSRGGRLPQPFRANLIGYLEQVRRFGFRRLTISFSPQWENSPLRDNYDPSRFAENWAFIQDIRTLALRHGPPEIRFDLLNEGAPSDYSPAAQRKRVARYVTRMWARYVGAYGPGDATVSLIAPRSPRDRGHRLANLLDALGSSGAPLPERFEVHVNYDASGVAWGLHAVDSVLTARGLHQGLTVGETSYDDAAAAAAISDFMTHSSRPVDEIIEWYKRSGAACEVSPPYVASAYLELAP